MKRPARVPTFDLLREKRLLAVYTPGGVHFMMSLRDWQGVLWAVRVQPVRDGSGGKRANPYTTAHRIMDRWRIEDWLAELRLA